MICYHGSIVPNLKALLPFKMPQSKMEESCVYFTTYKPLAALYIWSRKYMWLTYGFDKEDNLIYTESHPNALEEFYRDAKGYIYTCDVAESDILENKTGIRIAVAAKGEQKVLECEAVDDAYQKILEYEKAGEIIIRKYGELTPKEHKNNENMILSGIKRLDLLKGEHPLSSFVSYKFPELWERAKNEW